MKTKPAFKFAAALLLIFTISHPLATVFAQGTAFMYQGRLNNGASLANGLYDFQFLLSNAPAGGGSQIGGTVNKTAIGVTNGVFTATIDFGAVFTGSPAWLAIGLRTNGVGSYIGLSPLQQLTPTPFAIFAESANNLPNLQVQTNADGAPNLIGGSPVNYVAAGVEGATIGGGGALYGGGPYGTNSVTGNYGVIGGGVGNTAGYDSTVGGGQENTAAGQDATVGGGIDNIASGDGAFIGGGGLDVFDEIFGNLAGGISSVICGGVRNNATNNYATVGGGYENAAGGIGATVPGGEYNVALGAYSFAAGQEALAENQGAFVWADSQPTAFASTANDQFLIRAQGNVGINTGSPESELTVVQAVAGGRGAELSLVNPAASTIGNEVAINFGTDNSTYNQDNPNAQIKARSMNENDNRTDLIVSTWNGSTFAERMRVQSGGNVGIGTNNPAHLIQVVSAYCDGGAWVNGSDRNSKEDFAPVKAAEVLAKVAALPITQWRYKVESEGTEHLGPMAQDFHTAFGLNGADDKHISTVDEGGVALAAIQGLNQKLNEKDVEIEELRAKADQVDRLERQNDVLAERLNELEATVKRLVVQK